MKMKPHLLVNYYDFSFQFTNCYLYPDETLASTDNYEDLHLYLKSSRPCLILGPCNGIFAVRNNNDNQRIALWNPATKLIRPLPVADRPYIPSDFFTLSKISSSKMGFGFDANTHDYKVLWYREFGYNSESSQLLVYSLNANSWRELDHECFKHFKFNYPFHCESFSFNGVLYWIACRVDNETKIVGPRSLLPFDLSDEQFQDVIPVPNPSPGLESPSLAVCGGCIAIIDCNYAQCESNLNAPFLVRVWVMVEKGHWVYKFEIGPFEEIVSLYGMWKNDYVIIYTIDNELVLCDPFGQTWKKIKPFGSVNVPCFQAFVYSESLVSIKAGDHDSESDEEEDDIADFFGLSCSSTDEDL